MSSSTNQRVTRSSSRRTNANDAAGSASFTSADVSGSSTSSVAAWARPSLPVEVLTDIFKLALHSSTKPSTPFKSPISPYKPFASLLIASRTFRALAIPYVYRSITIARSRDWVAIFGAGRGAIVAGYDLVEKRQALEEICLAPEVDFPFDTDSRPTFSFVYTKGEDEYKSPLNLGGLQVKRVTILSLPLLDTERIEKLNVDAFERLFRHISADKKIRAKVAQEIARDEKTSVGLIEHEEVDEYIETTVRLTINRWQKGALPSFFQAIKPKTIRLSPRYTLPLLAHKVLLYRPCQDCRVYPQW